MQLRLRIVLAISLGLAIAAPRTSFAASLKVLHTFSGQTDGAIPWSDLIFDNAGNLYGTTVAGGLYNNGTVFELSPDGSGNWTETILYNFQGSADGEGPVAGLVMDTQGNLYGTTQIGGIQNGYCSGGCGVAFELSPSSFGWNYQVIYSFTNVPDGAFPSSDLLLDSAGNLYGVTSGGGTEGSVCVGVFPGCGTAFELVKANGWQEQILHRFNYSLTDGDYPAGKLLFDGHGNLYGTTESGGEGAHGLYHGTVFEMKPSSGAWTESLIYDFCQKVNCDDGSGPSSGVIEINGELYGTVPSGGANNYGGIFNLKRSGKNVIESSYLFDFADGIEPIAPPLYREGSLYGVTEQGGIENGVCTLFQMGNGLVFQMSLVNKVPEETVLYEFTGGDDGCGPVAGLVADSAGNLYGTTSQGGVNGGAVFEVTR